MNVYMYMSSFTDYDGEFVLLLEKQEEKNAWCSHGNITHMFEVLLKKKGLTPFPASDLSSAHTLLKKTMAKEDNLNKH